MGQQMIQELPKSGRVATGLERRISALAAALLALLALEGCGGGGGGSNPVADACSDGPRKAWLRSYMDDWYFWTALSPKPSPDGNSSLNAYFDALRYTGTDPNFPADRWSYRSDTDQFSRFFSAGETLGYGLMVAGVEVAGNASAPLYLRYVEPQSPAALAGLARGDRLINVNGNPVSTLIASNDFSPLSPGAAGDLLRLTVRRTGVADRDLSLTAAVYALTPVTGTRVVNSPAGRKLGYLMVKDMVTQAQSPYDLAMAQFSTAQVDDVVIDLRYNGGGLVSTAALLSSYVAASRTAGQLFTHLSFNSAHAAASNTNFGFSNPSSALRLPRAYVLTGPRTCSASELLVNGLRPFIEVVTIGATSCGKPVGFQSTADTCGSTWSVVNFESTNASGVGRYFDGLPATCKVTEDFSQTLGSRTEPLLAEAIKHADTGACSSLAAGSVTAQSVQRAPHLAVTDEPAGRGGMVLGR